MSYSIPDPHYEELLLPGVKPIGNVVIDFSNTMTRNLAGYFLFDKFIGGDKIKNIVTGHPDLTASDPANQSIVTTIKGRAVSQNDDYVGLTSDTDLSLWATNAMTFAVMYKLNSHQSSGGSSVIRGNSGSSLTSYIGIKDYSTKTDAVALINGLGKTASYSTGTPLDTWVIKVIKYDGLKLALWDSLAMNEVATLTQVGTLSTNTATDTKFRFGVGKAGDANRGFDGEVALGAVWKGRGISDSEVLSFFRNPYQFLIPA